VERLKIDVKKVLGLLLGIAVLGEGAFLISYARPANIGGIGGILGTTVAMAGAILALLGLLMVLSWILKDLKALQLKTKLYRILIILATVLHIAVLVVGLGLTLNARQVYFENGYHFGRVAVALLCAQLFVIGTFSTMLWLKRDAKVKNIVAFLGSVAGSSGLAAVGAALIGCAAPLTAVYLTEIGAGKMTLVGALFIVIGAISLMAWIFDGGKLAQGKWRMIWTALIGATSLVVMLMAVYQSGVASDFTIGDFFSLGKLWFVAFASGLFLLAALTFAAWMVREKTLNRKFGLQTAGMLAGILLATEGVAVFGFAGETTIEGLGTLPHGIILMFGAQMVLLGTISAASWILKDTKYFNFGFRKTALDLMMLFLMSIAVVDGLAVLMVAAPTDIAGIGGILQRTMLMFGASVASLGLLSLLTWTFRENPAPPRLKRMEFLVILFWALMIGAGLFL
jgi:hypothetical protein